MKNEKEIHHFWKWFVWFAGNFPGFPDGREEDEHVNFFLDEISVHLYGICPHLCFDFHPAHDSRKATLVISTHSDREYFAEARHVARLSPPLNNLEVRALRQAGDFDTCFAERVPAFPFVPEDLYFDCYIDDLDPYRMEYLAVYLPGFEDDKYDLYLEPVRLLLENILGEETVGEVIGMIYLVLLEEELIKEGMVTPVTALPTTISNMKSRYHVNKAGVITETRIV